jgi:hypothetical protein
MVSLVDWLSVGALGSALERLIRGIACRLAGEYLAESVHGGGW